VPASVIGALLGWGKDGTYVAGQALPMLLPRWPPFLVLIGQYWGGRYCRLRVGCPRFGLGLIRFVQMQPWKGAAAGGAIVRLIPSVPNAAKSKRPATGPPARACWPNAWA